MSDIKPYKQNAGAVATKPVNIDGKGLNGFLLDWYRSEPRGVVAKPQRQVLTANYLYLDGNAWLLSLIAPQQWSAERQAGFVGTCVLQKDMTWTIEPSDNLKQAGPVTDAVGRFYDAFADTLDTNLTLEEILPFYVGRMPYYQRLYANALSRSIRAAVTLGEQRDICSRDWQQILPRREFMLLSGANS